VGLYILAAVIFEKLSQWGVLNAQITLALHGALLLALIVLPWYQTIWTTPGFGAFLSLFSRRLFLTMSDRFL